MSNTALTTLLGNGRYRTLVKLGSGGMADVFLGVARTSSGIEKLAVIKRLRADLGDDPEEVAHFKGMFWDEARLAMLLNHANVVHTHDACEEDGSLCLVMEYIEGHALSSVHSELVRLGRPLSPVHSALIVSEILAGLHYAHDLRSHSGEQLNIVHRDVSPQNILLGYDGSIKLVDFGVAKAASRSTETRAGTLKGKARYMAPEQVLNEAVDRRSDVYSTGVVLWELIARRKLVGGATMIEQLVNVIKSEPERLSTVVPDVDLELEAIVHKALARQPSARFETAAAMRDALLGWANRDGDVRVAEIGVLVTEAFAAKRREVAAVIRERLALGADAGPISLSAPASRIPELISDGSISASVRPASFTPHGVVQNVGQSTASMSPPEPAPPPSRKTTTFLVAGLLASLAAASVLAGMVVSSARRAPARAGDPSATSLAPPSAPASPVPPPIEVLAAPSTVGAAEGPVPIASVRVAAPAPVIPRARAPAVVPPREAPPPPVAVAPAATAAEAEQGYLTIDTYPWTKVSEGGRLLGTTPLVRVPIASGTHVLTLDNAQDNVHQTTTVIVKPGETVSRRLAF